MPGALSRLGPPAQAAAIVFAIAALCRFVGTLIVEDAPALFTVLAIIDSLAVAAGWAIFALSGLTAGSKVARIAAWALAALFAAVLVSGLLTLIIPEAFFATGILAWIILAAGVVLGIAMSRDTSLPQRFRMLPLAYFVILIACVPIFAGEPELASYSNAVILLLFALCLYFVDRRDTAAQPGGDATGPASVNRVSSAEGSVRPVDDSPPDGAPASLPDGAAAPAAPKTPSLANALSPPDPASRAPVPGWYDDPLQERALRWWDGSAWTREVRDDATERRDAPGGA
ncbi:DUF2510 domain-containing protein [Ruicaihuangia caeni]|nr:DUF2510 domain-containing protein [Klugiella sp. YN-L-19]